MTADTYCIHANTEGLGYLSSRHRVDIAAVITSVRQQDNHFRLRRRVFHTIHAVGQTQTDSSSVLNHAELNRTEQVHQRRMVCRQRALRKRLPCKHHKAYLVIRTTDHEVRCHVLSRFQTVRLQVLCQHRSRHVKSHHDIDTFRRFGTPFITQLRACKRYAQARDQYHTQHKRHMQQVDACTLLLAA